MTRQYNQLISLMANWDKMQSNVQIASGAEGTLQKQADIYADSWQAASDRVRAALEAIYDDLISDDFFITLLDGFKLLLNGVDNFIDGIGGLPGVLGLASTIMFKMFGPEMATGIDNLILKIKGFGNSTKEQMEKVRLDTINAQQDALKQMAGAYSGESAKSFERLIKLQDQLIVKAKDLSSEDKQVAQLLLDQLNILEKQVVESEKLLKNKQTDVENQQGSVYTVITTSKRYQAGQQNLQGASKRTQAGREAESFDQNFDAFYEKARQAAQELENFKTIRNALRAEIANNPDIGIDGITASLDKLSGALPISKDLLDKIKTALANSNGDMQNFATNLLHISGPQTSFNNSINELIKILTPYQNALSKAGINLDDIKEKLSAAAKAQADLNYQVLNANEAGSGFRGFLNSAKVEISSVGNAAVNLAKSFSMTMTGAQSAKGAIEAFSSGNIESGLMGVSSAVTSIFMAFKMGNPWIALATTTLSTLITFIPVITQAWKENHDSVVKVTKAHEKLAEAAKESSKIYSEVKSAYDSYNKVIQTIDNCTQGTQEWRDALQESYDIILDLIKVSPDLAAKIEYDEFGRATNLSELVAEKEAKKRTDDYSEQLSNLLINLAENQKVIDQINEQFTRRPTEYSNYIYDWLEQDQNGNQSLVQYAKDNLDGGAMNAFINEAFSSMIKDIQNYKGQNFIELSQSLINLILSGLEQYAPGEFTEEDIRKSTTFQNFLTSSDFTDYFNFADEAWRQAWENASAKDTIRSSAEAMVRSALGGDTPQEYIKIVTEDILTGLDNAVNEQQINELKETILARINNLASFATEAKNLFNKLGENSNIFSNFAKNQNFNQLSQQEIDRLLSQQYSGKSNKLTYYYEDILNQLDDKELEKLAAANKQTVEEYKKSILQALEDSNNLRISLNEELKKLIPNKLDSNLSLSVDELTRLRDISLQIVQNYGKEYFDNITEGLDENALKLIADFDWGKGTWEDFEKQINSITDKTPEIEKALKEIFNILSDSSATLLGQLRSTTKDVRKTFGKAQTGDKFEVDDVTTLLSQNLGISDEYLKELFRVNDEGSAILIASHERLWEIINEALDDANAKIDLTAQQQKREFAAERVEKFDKGITEQQKEALAKIDISKLQGKTNEEILAGLGFKVGSENYDAYKNLLETFATGPIEDLEKTLFKDDGNFNQNLLDQQNQNMQKFTAVLYSIYANRIEQYRKQATASAIGADEKNLTWIESLQKIWDEGIVNTEEGNEQVKQAAILQMSQMGLNYDKDFIPLLNTYLNETSSNYFFAANQAMQDLIKSTDDAQGRTQIAESLSKTYSKTQDQISKEWVNLITTLATEYDVAVEDILKSFSTDVSEENYQLDANIAAAAAKAGTTGDKVVSAQRQGAAIFGQDFNLPDFIKGSWQEEWNKVAFDTLTSLLSALGISDPNEAYEAAYAYGQAAADGIVDSFGNVIKPDAKELVDIGNYLKQAFGLEEADTESVKNQAVAIEQAISEANTQLANNFGELGDKVSITADEFGQMMNVLSSDFGSGMEEAEKATDATTEALIAIKEKGLNTKEVIDYTKYLDTLNEELGDNVTKSRKVALAVRNIQWKNVTKEVKSYVKEIVESTEYNDEFYRSCGEIAKAFNDTFGTNITAKWVGENKAQFTKWYSASDELKNDIAETILQAASLESKISQINGNEIIITVNNEQLAITKDAYDELIQYMFDNPGEVDIFGNADLTNIFQAFEEGRISGEALAALLADIGSIDIEFFGDADAAMQSFIQTIKSGNGSMETYLAAINDMRGKFTSFITGGGKIKRTGGSSYANIGSPSKTSSGGGGKSSKPAEQKSDIEKERYHTVQNQLEDLSAEYDAISDAKDRAFGKDKLKMLDAEIAKNDELIEKQKEYLNEIKNYESIDLPVMQATYDQVIGGPAMEFDVRGNISNFDEIQDAMFNKYNEMAASLTSDSADWEIFEKQYEQLQKYIDQYEETYDLRREEEEKYQEMLDKRTDMMLEKIKMEVELKMDISEDSLEMLEYELKKLDDKAFTAAEAIELLARKIDNFYEQVGHDREEIDKILAQQLSSAEIVQFHQGDMSVLEGKVFTQDQIDTIREAKDNILDLNESILETKKGIEDQLMKAFDEFDDKIDSAMEKFDHYQSIMENFQNIIDIVGKDLIGVDDAAMNTLMQTQIDNAINKVEASKDFLDSVVKQTEQIQSALEDAYSRGVAEEIEYWEEQLNQMDEKTRQAQEELVQNWEDSLQAITNQFEKAVDAAVDKFNKALYGPGGLEALQKDFDWEQSEKDLHVEDYEKIYELSKLNRDINNTIDDTKNIAGKKKLKDLQDKILAAQKDGVEVSKYDLEYLQKEYELRKAEIELEEARNAKDTVRMNRDTEGNWSYIYTQNTDQVNDSQQKYEDALYAMQELTTNYINEVSKDLIDSSREMEEELATLRVEDFASMDDYYKAIEDVVNKYQERMAIQEDELNKSIENNKNLYEQDWKNYSEFTGYKISATDDFITSFKDSALGALLDSDSQAADFMGQVNQKLPDFVNNLLLAGDGWYNNVANAFDAAGSSLTGFNEDLDELVTGVQNSSDAAATEVENMANRMEDAMDDVINKIGAFTSEFKEFFEMIEDNESTIDRMLDLLSTLSIPGVTVSQVRGDAPAAGYDTGGYTGTWGPTGKYAVLHEKELVLNADDTANLLASVSLVRALTQQIDQNASYASLGLGDMAGQVSYKGNDSQDIQQQVYINAEFPNVTSSNEIEQALRNMSNSASQYVNRQ